jgi:hypothetical protein
MSPDPGCKIPIGLVSALREAGVSAEHVLAAARLPSRLLDTPGRYVPPSDYFALWKSIRAVSGDPGIGMRLATLVKPELTEPLFLAVLSAGNLAEAIGVVSRFKRLLEPEDLVVVEDAATERLVVTYRWSDAEDEVPQALVDAELAFLVQIGRRGTSRPDLSPREIFLRTSALDAGGEHEDFFRCAIRLGAPRNAIAFALDDTRDPFATRNPELLNALLPHLEANTPVPPDAGLARVRSVIAERVRGRRPEADEVARELAMSTRAMQRGCSRTAAPRSVGCSMTSATNTPGAISVRQCSPMAKSRFYLASRIPTPSIVRFEPGTGCHRLSFVGRELRAGRHPATFPIRRLRPTFAAAAGHSATALSLKEHLTQWETFRRR